MSLLAVALAAAATASSPAAPATYRPVASVHHDGCGPQIDPEFARYVPPAPLADGKNPLLRLISDPGDSYSVGEAHWRTTRACLRDLRQVDFAR
jgi:hypothetical protein